MCLWWAGDLHIFKFKWSCQAGVEEREEKPNIVTWHSLSLSAPLLLPLSVRCSFKICFNQWDSTLNKYSLVIGPKSLNSSNQIPLYLHSALWLIRISNFLKEPRLWRSVVACCFSRFLWALLLCVSPFLSFFPLLYFSSRFPHVVNFASSAPSLSPHLPTLPPSLAR